jgi:hypothetical protein
MRMFCTVLLILGLSGPAQSGGYENKWIVVLGSTRDLKEAWRIKAGGDVDAEILHSTRYSKLEPGLFVVVAEGGQTKNGARALARKLKKQGIESEAKFTGPFFDFKKKKYRMEKVASKDLGFMRSGCFIYQNEDSPDGSISVSIRGQDPTSSVLLVRQGDEEAFIEKLFFQAEKVFWSNDSRYVAFGDDDNYAGSGNRGFLIVDVQQKTFMAIETAKLGTGPEHGKRDMFKLSKICWLPPGDRVMFSLAVDFMGSSGHPGIDEERKDRLGDDFGKSDPVDLGTYLFYLEPKEVDLKTMPTGLKVYAEDKYGYIDKTGQIVIKPRYDSAGPFEGGVATVRQGGKEKTIDTKGRPAKPQKKKAAPPPEKPSADLPTPMKLGDRYGYKDKSGMIVIDPLFDEAGEFKDGLALVKVDGDLGFIDPQGKTVVEPEWEELHPFKDDLARVRSGGKYGFVDRKGKVVVEPRFKTAGDFSEGLAPVILGPSANQ